MIDQEKKTIHRRILLLGGTGAMGEHLTRILAEQGDDVYVTTRSCRLSERNITYVQGNAHEITFINDLLRESWDAIVDFMVYNTDEFRVRVSQLLKATKQYIFISSARVYGPTTSSDELINEETPRLLDMIKDEEYLNTDEYALSKARQENILHEAGCNNWTIIRPYITFSETRLQLGVLEKEDWLWRAMNGYSIVFSKDIASHYTTLTYGYDVSRGIAGLIGLPAALGEVYHITTDEAYKWEEILEVYLHVLDKYLGHRPKVVMTDKCLNLRFPAMQFQVKYCRLFDRRFDNSKIRLAVPTLRFKNTRDEIESCLGTFLESPLFSSPALLLNAQMDRVTGERMRLNIYSTLKSRLKYLVARYAPTEIVKVLTK